MNIFILFKFVIYIKEGIKDSSGGIFGGSLTLIFAINLAILPIIGFWKVFAKAGKPGWAAIIPFYNLYVLFEITWGSGIKFLLILIPFANIIIMFITLWKLGNAFGKDGAFTVGLMLLPSIFIIILGLGDSEYIGVPGAANTNN